MLTVPYLSQAAVQDPANQNAVDPGQPRVTITNGSDQPVVVIAIAADQTQQALKQLAAGETSDVSVVLRSPAY